ARRSRGRRRGWRPSPAGLDRISLPLRSRSHTRQSTAQTAGPRSTPRNLRYGQPRVSQSEFNATRIAWVGGTALAVFVFWALTGGSTGASVSFFYALPVGLGTWWW